MIELINQLPLYFPGETLYLSLISFIRINGKRKIYYVTVVLTFR